MLALIPARGGSKGIPRKNLLPIGGQPLIAYSIAQALALVAASRARSCPPTTRRLRRVARECGAEVPFMRPAEFAQDLSTDLDVFRHALAWLRDREGYRCDLVVHLRPTAPVRDVAVIDRAIDLMLSTPTRTRCARSSAAEAVALQDVAIERRVPGAAACRCPACAESHSRSAAGTPRRLLAERLRGHRPALMSSWNTV